jgi:hypothetical protein
MEFPDDMQENIGLKFFHVIPHLLELHKKYKIIELEKHIDIIIKDYTNDEKMCKILTQLTPKKHRKKGHITNKISFVGKIDAWVLRGKYKSIIDWKSGGFSEKKFREHSQQIQIYSYIMRLIGEEPEKGYVVYLEHKNQEGGVLEKEVDINIPLCETVFKKFINKYIKKISNGINFENFKKCCSKQNSTWCEFSRMCSVINDERLDSQLLKQVVMLKINNNTKHF